MLPLIFNLQVSPGPTHSGRPRSVTTPANSARVRNVCAHDAAKELDVPHSPISSGRRNVLGLAPAAWWRITKAEKLHPYKVIRSHKLLPADYPRRVAMCRFLVTLTPAQLSNFLFSDEATFCVDGSVNSQNVRKYAPRKGSLPPGQQQGRPPNFRITKSTFSSKVMVVLGEHYGNKKKIVTNVHPCSGLRGDGTLFGYTKIQGTLNSQAYHNLLQYRVLPEVRAGNGGTLAGLTWQQDGATPHASDLNIRYLANQFGGRLLARRSEGFGGRDWAARSPDLNPLDYGTGWLFSRN